MKVRRPQAAEPGHRAPAPLPADFMDNWKGRFIPLACGHGTDWDTDAAYRLQGSPRDKCFCDKCGKWVKPKPKPKPAPLPAEPLF